MAKQVCLSMIEHWLIALDCKKPIHASLYLSNELDTPQSCHNAAVNLGPKLSLYRRIMFAGRRFGEWAAIRVSGGSLHVSEGSRHPNHLKLYCVGQASFPTKRLEIVV